MCAEQTWSHRPAIPAPREIPLHVLPPHPCNYFPDRIAQTRAIYASGQISPDLYHEFMDAGFRRSGRLIYQPMCAGCRDCVPLRVHVDRFSPGKSQRRVRRRNQDLSIRIAHPVCDDEAFDLYSRYLRDWHGERSANGTDRESFQSFLYDSPVRTIEFRYRNAAEKLLAVGLCDICSRSLSSVYFYFDPAERKRALGTLGALVELDYARSIGVPYYYLGYWIGGCMSMKYKASFRPSELLGGDGEWRTPREQPGE